MANNQKNPYSRAKGGRRIDLDNRYFRSSWEANYARYLNWLMSIGHIHKWEYEVDVFEFPFKRGNTTYTPDFKVFKDHDCYEYHEIKGWMDKDSAVKLKRMIKYYPNEKVIVVDKKQYYALARDVKNVINGWECDAKHSI